MVETSMPEVGQMEVEVNISQPLGQIPGCRHTRVIYNQVTLQNEKQRRRIVESALGVTYAVNMIIDDLRYMTMIQ